MVADELVFDIKNQKLNINSFNDDKINANEGIVRPKIKFFGKIFLRNLDLLVSSNFLFEAGATHIVKNNM